MAEAKQIVRPVITEAEIKRHGGKIGRDEKNPHLTVLDLTTRVDLVALEGAPYHKANQKISVHPAQVEKYLQNKWAKKA